ncbi:MAG: YhfX family PLP-dependent enzyme [Thermoanaerobacteraceae bacterium]|nr:YhfX family PLP-dependent enzyme [Thermoanaerobacteraceae bacterium]
MRKPGDDMFLEAVLKSNPALIDAAYKLYKDGDIGPNTYCVDLSMIKRNASLIAREGKEYGIELYFMTKQFGRNPVISQAIVESGIEKAVAVDMDEARVLHRNGIKIGHMGHLVQIAKRDIKEALDMRPEVITCFSAEKAAEINEVAAEMGLIQDILLRVIDNGDYIYPGQEGGIRLECLEETVDSISKLGNVRIVGVTSFPCFLYSEDSRAIEPTTNVYTIKRAAEILRGMGIEVKQINGPSATCVSSIPILKKMGMTHGEPGHALTGTTPLHARGDEPEGQAIVYITEVSHRDRDRAYVFGGGFYPRSRMKKAYSPRLKTTFDVEEIPTESIDYYGTIIDKDRFLNVGDAALYAFRTQVFVTRAKVAVIDGIREGRPRLVGIFTSLGDEIR